MTPTEAAEAMRESAARIADAMGGCGSSCGMDGKAAAAIRALPLPTAPDSGEGADEIRLAAIARANALDDHYKYEGQKLAEAHAEHTRLKAALKLAEWGLQVGKAWTGEYLENCKEEQIAAEIERVERGLVDIEAALAAIRNTGALT